MSNDNLIGKKIGELNSNDDFFICGYHENDDENISIATADMVLKDNCRISMLVKSDSMAKVLDMFTK